LRASHGSERSLPRRRPEQRESILLDRTAQLIDSAPVVE
jgi:hypothetical protein